MLTAGVGLLTGEPSAAPTSCAKSVANTPPAKPTTTAAGAIQYGVGARGGPWFVTAPSLLRSPEAPAARPASRSPARAAGHLLARAPHPPPRASRRAGALAPRAGRPRGPRRRPR